MTKVMNRFTGEVILERETLLRADLRDVRGNRREVKSIHVFDEYDIAYTATHLQVGCERHVIEDWWGFSDERIGRMDGDAALRFWHRNKQLIRQIIETNPAEPTGAENNESK